MALVTNGKTGRSDADHPTAMKVSRTPVFVDNCIHHGVYSTGKVTPSTRGDFQITNSQSYLVIEEEGAARLVHRQTDGHNYTGDVFFNKSKLTTGSTRPTVLYGADNDSQRLVVESVESGGIGSRLNLPNMRGLSLSKIGFNQKAVRLGQEVDVGLRTSDLAMRLAEPVGEILTSVNIADKSKLSSTYNQRVQHTQKFLSQDFRGVNLVTALRYTGRHDGRVLYYDRWGNLLYIPFRAGGTGRRLKGRLTLGRQTRDTIEDSPNRVTIIGEQRALNHNATVTMDDRSTQRSKDGSSIVREASPIQDPTVKNTLDGRRVARQVLRAHAAAKGSLSITKQANAWDLRAGDIVQYEGRGGRKTLVISSSTHRMSNRESDFGFLSFGTGVEGILQGITESAISLGDLLPDKTVQLKKEEMSLFLDFTLRTSLLVRVRSVNKQGKRVGHRAASIVGRKHQTGYAAEGDSNGESAGSNKHNYAFREVVT